MLWLRLTFPPFGCWRVYVSERTWMDGLADYLRYLM